MTTQPFVPTVASDRVLGAKANIDEEVHQTETERGELLVSLFRAAMEIEQSKIASGLPASEPAPWPQSTWEFQRKWTQHARTES